MAKNVKFVDVSEMHKCYKCEGTGVIPNPNFDTKNIWSKPKKSCDVCEGTGKYKEEFYHLIATTPSGNKIAFGVDQAGK